MTIKYIAGALVVSAICTFLLRALPFLIAGSGKLKSDKLDFLGMILPPAIMAVLLVYCMKDIMTDMTGIGIPKIAGVAVTAVSYLWKKNSFLSIIFGTATYMLLLRVFY